jgi:hypothetical protein
MITITPTSRQPVREPWSEDRLLYERSIALGLVLDRSTNDSYSSAANSYITFCRIHNRALEPTEDTLSYYVVFMCAFVKAKTVDSYLSGICNQLEHYFPNIRLARRSSLVSQTLRGCKRRYGTEVTRKKPLSKSDLQIVINAIGQSKSHDDCLFLVLLLTGFHALCRLGELVWPDKVAHQNYRKLALRSSVTWPDNSFGFLLPANKTDPFFEGNRLVIQRLDMPTDPFRPFRTYLASRDKKFLHHPELWVRSDGSPPKRAWFIRRLRTYFPKDIAGQSMRAGGATSLAEAGVPPNHIQAIGRWSSDTFKIYLRKNPTVVHALIFGGRPAHQPV